MNNIPRVLYPIDRNLTEQLSQLPGIASCLRLPPTDQSELEIVRLLGSTHYEQVRRRLEYLEKNIPIAEFLIKETLKQTDPFEFEGKMSELFLYSHIANFAGNRLGPSPLPRSEKRPDMIVRCDNLEIAIEVYSPINLFGFQLVENYLLPILRYLDIDLGYILDVAIEPSNADTKFSYATEPGVENEVRRWLRDFSDIVADWLSKQPLNSALSLVGPMNSGWKVTLSTKEFHDRAFRKINQSSATRSDDARLYFDIGDAYTTASTWWGRAIRKKMDERQAGAAPISGLLRVLIIDFDRLDTGYPKFFSWPDIAQRIDEAVRILASEIPVPLPYDVVIPASLDISCCFGSAVWLNNEARKFHQTAVQKVGLTVPCECSLDKQTDWLTFIRG